MLPLLHRDLKKWIGKLLSIDLYAFCAIHRVSYLLTEENFSKSNIRNVYIHGLHTLESLTDNNSNIQLRASEVVDGGLIKAGKGRQSNYLIIIIQVQRINFENFQGFRENDLRRFRRKWKETQDWLAGIVRFLAISVFWQSFRRPLTYGFLFSPGSITLKAVNLCTARRKKFNYLNVYALRFYMYLKIKLLLHTGLKRFFYIHNCIFDASLLVYNNICHLFLGMYTTSFIRTIL